jgi:hypothetical protein
MFGSLSPLSSAPAKPRFDEPPLADDIDTGYGQLYSVSCVSKDQVWTCGDNKLMKLLNLRGELLASIQTKSGEPPGDIALTRGGYLVYTDYKNKTVNRAKDKQIQTIISSQRWGPRYICSTASDDLLVIMVSDDRKETKVVRYSGSIERQTIQFDAQGLSLYSSGYNTKYISENKNLDICVADYKSKTVVVVNQSGKLRFKYTGHPSHLKEPFDPAGITTDSQSHILIADCDNHRIHILNQDGQFLRYIHNWGLCNPWGLCVDIGDNLYVANGDNKVKRIEYL